MRASFIADGAVAERAAAETAAMRGIALVERSLFFVSARENPDGCGGGDIYLSRQSPAGEWGEPAHLPCAPNGPNTAGTERSPSLVETWYGTFLFYSTNTGGVNGADEDIYVSIAFLPFWWTKPQNLVDVNTTANETRATLSHDGERLYLGRGDVWVSKRR